VRNFLSYPTHEQTHKGKSITFLADNDNAKRLAVFIIRALDAESSYHGNVVEQIHVRSVGPDVGQLQQ